MVSTRTVVAWSERRQFVELAAVSAASYVDRKEIEMADQDEPGSEEQVRQKVKEVLKALEEETL